MMVVFIAAATWSLKPILTPASTMNSRDTSKQAPIYFYQRMTLNLGGMNLSSQLHKLSNLS